MSTSRNIDFKNTALQIGLGDPSSGAPVLVPREGTSLPIRLSISSAFEGANLWFQRFTVRVRDDVCPGVYLFVENEFVKETALEICTPNGGTRPTFLIHRERGAGSAPVVIIVSSLTDPENFIPVEVRIPIDGIVNFEEAPPVLLRRQDPPLEALARLPTPVRDDALVPLDDPMLVSRIEKKTGEITPTEATPARGKPKDLSLAIGPLRLYFAHRKLIIHRSDTWRLRYPSFSWTIDHSLAAALALLALSIAITWPSWMKIFQILSY